MINKLLFVIAVLLVGLIGFIVGAAVVGYLREPSERIVKYEAGESLNSVVEFAADTDLDTQFDEWHVNIRDTEEFRLSYIIRNEDFDGIPDKATITIGDNLVSIGLRGFGRSDNPRMLMFALMGADPPRFIYRDLDANGELDEMQSLQDDGSFKLSILLQDQWVVARRARGNEDFFEAIIRDDDMLAEVEFADGSWKRKALP